MKNIIDTKTITINDIQYQNKLVESTFDIEAKKQAKKDIKNIIINIINNNKDDVDTQKQKFTTYYIKKDEFSTLKNLCTKLLDKNYNFESITYKNMREAIDSATTYKQVKSDERYKKQHGASISVKAFLVAIQSSIIKKVESSKRQDYLLDQKKRQQAKIDKELARQQKKTNKRVEKQQKANGTLKTRITD